MWNFQTEKAIVYFTKHIKIIIFLVTTICSVMLKVGIINLKKWHYLFVYIMRTSYKNKFEGIIQLLLAKTILKIKVIHYNCLVFEFCVNIT